MNPNGNPQNLKPVRPGEVRNPRGINQWTYRDAAEKHLQEWCQQHGRDAVRMVADAARAGEPWAAKLLWDRLLPAVTKHDIEARVSGQLEVTSESEWAALSSGLDRVQHDTPRLVKANGNGSGASGDSA